MRRVTLDDEGMTLLELLVVIVILGILATLGSLQVFGYLGKAKSETARLQLRELATAVDVFRIDTARVPTADEGLEALMREPASPAPGWSGPYLRNRAILKDPWGRPYLYRKADRLPGYEILTLGADGEPGGDGERKDVSTADGA